MTEDYKRALREAGTLATEIIEHANVLGAEQRWFDVFALIVQTGWAVEQDIQNRAQYARMQEYEKERAALEARYSEGRITSVLPQQEN